MAHSQYEQVSSLRLLMMHDSEGKVLLVVPAALEVKANLLASATGRQLQAIKPEALRRFFRQAGMRRLEGQRKLFKGLPVFVDESVSFLDWPLLEASTGLLLDDELLEEYRDKLRFVKLGKSIDYSLCQPDADHNEIADAIYKFTSRRLSDRIEETLALPTLSPTAQKLMRLRGDPDAGIDQLLPLVSNDPSYSAQAMAWANSPMFAAPGRAHSLDDAVVRILGFDLVINLGLSLVIGKELNLPFKGPRGAVPYWQRSLATAFLSEKLGRQIPVTKRPQLGLVYLSGLLHNFGTLLLGHLFPPQFDEVCEAISINPHIESWKLERSLLGVDSAQMAAWLFAHWSLPESIVDAIRWQNHPEHAPNSSTLPMLLLLCGRLLREQGLSDGPVLPLPDSMLDALGLQFAQIDKVVSNFEELEQNVKETVAQLKL